MSRSLSASAITKFLDCGQLFDLTYNHGLEPVDSSSFEANYGRAFHALREGDNELLEALFGAHWAQIIQIHYEAYCTRWSDKHEQYWRLRDLDHEIKFQFELAPGYRYHGIVDGVVELEGKNFLIETKTTGQMPEKALTYRENSIQSGLYQLAAIHAPELQQYNAQGIIYDITRRPSIRQRSNESKASYRGRVAQWYPDNRETAFGRYLVKHEPELLDRIGANLMTVTDMINTNLFASNPNTCYKYNRTCGFSDYCFGSEKLSNTNLFQPRKKH